jgi:hypothetical protein
MFIYLGTKVFINLSLFSIKLICTNLMDTPFIYGDVTWYISCTNISLMVFTFLVLMYMMRRFHNFEFKRSKNKLLLNFILEVSIYTFAIFCYTTQDYNNKLTVLPAAIYISNLPQILLAIAIYKYRVNSDVLQDINKLDYYLKVSIF